MCGNVGKLSREHAIPKWTHKVLDPSLSSIGHKYEGPPDSGILREWRACGPDVKAKDICVPCNNGWMERLERAARPMLKPLILGEPCALSTLDGKLLTRWFLKTSVMLELAGSQGQRTIPTAVERWVYEDRTPTEGVALWLGSARRPHGAASGGRSAETRLGAEPPCPAWMFVIILGRLVLAAIGEVARTPVLDGPLAGALCRVWPTPLVLASPPRVRLSRKQVPLVLHMLAASLT